MTDLENAFQRVVGDDWEWKHDDEDGPNAPSHARASLASSPQVLIPLRDGGLALGTYQGVFFCEFDGPRERKIYVTTLLDAVTVGAWPRPSPREKSSSSTSTRSRSAATASRGSTASSSSCGAGCRATACARGSRRSSAATRRRSRPRCCGRGRSGSTRRAPTSPPAAAAASRISPTRRSSRRRRCRCATRCSGSRGIAEPPLEPILPCEPEIFHYRNKLEYSFTATPDGPALGFHRAGRWDEVLEIERCWLIDELGNGIRDAVRDWAREEGLEAYSQADGSGYLRHLVVRQGRNTGQALVQLVTAPGERFETGYLVDVLRRFPEVRSIHWAVNDTPAEVTNLPTRLLWGEEWIEEELCGLRFRVRPNAFLQTNTAMAERLYALAREAARAHRRRDRLGSLLRDRHDRALARRATR